MAASGELYISVDIEADGPYPGDYSMTSLGAVAAGIQQPGGTLIRLDPTAPENRFYGELQPISDNWVPEAAKVALYTGFGSEEQASDVDGTAVRAYTLQNGRDPHEVMTQFSEQVEEWKQRFQVKAVIAAAFPLGFDWMFMYWYLMKFSKHGSPFGHGRHLDIKTLFAEKSENLFSRAGKHTMPAHLHSTLPHTHLAVDDAAGQGELLMNILDW